MDTAIGWLRLQSAVDHLRHLIVRIGARAARAQFRCRIIPSPWRG
jgi:hypothetical protein